MVVNALSSLMCHGTCRAHRTHVAPRDNLAAQLGIGFVGTRVASMLRLPHSVLLVLLGIVGGSILKWSHAPIPHDWGELYGVKSQPSTFN